MKKLNVKTIFIILLGLSMGACASKQVSEGLDAKLAKEDVVPTNSEIPKHAFEQINKSALSDEQKTRLNVLIAKVVNETSQNKTETLKLKKVLFKSLAILPYNEDEIELIKERLTKLDKEKLKTMFTALDEVRNILGENSKERQHVLEMMLDMDRVPSRIE